MSNGPSNGTAGIGGVLTTLASSGDNWVKLLIVLGLIINPIITQKNGDRTRSDVDSIRSKGAKQIQVIYANQRVWAAFANAIFQENNLLLDKLGVPVEQRPERPKIKYKPSDEEEAYEND